MDSPDPSDQIALLQIQAILDRLYEIEKVGLPQTYGLPDLFFPKNEGESDADYRKRREVAVKTCVEEHLKVVKDSRVLQIRLIPEMVRLLTDLLYGYANRVILWKPRGAGGSLVAAVAIWLFMVYRRLSCLDLAGSGSQAKAVYEYVKRFWALVPGVAEQLVDGDPLMSSTTLKTGVHLECIPASQTQVRSKHLPFLVIDEACQDQSNKDSVFMAAMQGPLSEDNSTIMLLSTFHLPSGFFQQYWDDAESKGFTTYKWDVYDCMEPCKQPHYCLPEQAPLGWDDPNLCPLTRREPLFDDQGNPIPGKYEAIGCRGRARTSQGFKSFEKVMESFKQNLGSDVFRMEHECNRPEGAGRVIPEAQLVNALVPDIPREPKSKRAVGIDWGLVGQTACVLAERWAGKPAAQDVENVDAGTIAQIEAGDLQDDGYVGIHEAQHYTGMLVADILPTLKLWEEKYGPFVILSDQSHPFNNLELKKAGFEVIPVGFGKWKTFGYGNFRKYFRAGRIRLKKSQTELVRQLRKLRRNDAGVIVKKHDHGPDALMCALLMFVFPTEFPQDSGADPEEEEKAASLQNVMFFG